MGVDERGIAEITGKHKLYYPLLLLVELQGVVFKEVRKRSFREIPEKAVDGFISLVYGEHVEILPPAEEDLNTSYDLILSGWNDIFDAILYAVSKRAKMRVLTMDMAFKNFLKEKGFDYELFVTPNEARHK